MKIRCAHGFFMFSETSPGDISRFMSLFEGLELVAMGDFYTFKNLSEAPRHSIKGGDLLGQTAIKTFEGEPWEIFEQNALVYDFNTGKLKPINSVTQIISLDIGVNYFLSDGLILPGSLTDGGDRVRDYSAWFSFETMAFKYSEVSFV